MESILTLILDAAATLVIAGGAIFFIGLSWQSNTTVWKEHLFLGGLAAFLIWRIWA